MMDRQLLARIDGQSINLQTGEFPMTLATDGEASDGDILSIEGARFPERTPLQNAHRNEALSTLGSVTGFRRDLKSTPKRLRARGQIELSGEGPQADIRRDVAFMVSRDHIKGVSVRWEPISWVRRVNLPVDHFAYVDDEKEKDWRKRYGIFFKEWRVLEGSIAPVQADPEAAIGRAGETDGEVAEFWRSMAAEATKERDPRPMPEASEFEDKFDFMRVALPAAIAVCASEEDATEHCEKTWASRATQRPDPSDYDSKEAFMADCIPIVMAEGKTQEQATGQCSGMWENRAAKEEKPPEPEKPSPEALAAAAAAQIREFEAAGLSREDLLALLAPEPTTEEKLDAALRELKSSTERINALEAQVASVRDQGRVNGEPAPPLRTIPEIFKHLDELVEGRTRKAIAAAAALIDKRMGRSPKDKTYMDLLHDETEAMLKEHLGVRAEEPFATPEERLALADRLESMVQQVARSRAEKRQAAPAEKELSNG